VYLYTGVLNYETVRHTSSLLVYGTHTYLVLNNFLSMSGLRVVIEVFTFLSVFDTLFPKIHHNIILPPMPGSSK